MSWQTADFLSANATGLSPADTTGFSSANSTGFSSADAAGLSSAQTTGSWNARIFEKPQSWICGFGWVENGFRPPNGHIGRSPHEKCNSHTNSLRRTCMEARGRPVPNFFQKKWNDGWSGPKSKKSRKKVVAQNVPKWFQMAPGGPQNHKKMGPNWALGPIWAQGSFSQFSLVAAYFP